MNIKKNIRIILILTFSMLVAAISSTFIGCSSHEHELTHLSPKPSTCTDTGTMECWHCNICGKYFLNEECKLEISERIVVIPLANHDYGEWVVVSESTETETGERYRICSVCGYKEVETIDKLDHAHKYSEEWTSDISGHWHEAICDCVNPPVKDFNGHIVGNDNKCTVCGFDIGENSLLKLSSGDYGYNTLQEDMKGFYDALKEKISDFHDNGNATTHKYDGKDIYVVDGFNYVNYGLSKNQAMNVYKVFRADNPLYYWLDSATLYTANTLYPCVIDEYVDKSARRAVTAALETSVRKFYFLADHGVSNYRKVLCYHDAIINAVDYAYDVNGQPNSAHWAHSILGVFLNGSYGINGAVCEGYTEAFQLLLNLAGVDNLLVTGVGVTQTGSEGHAWNLVKIDSDYYYFDLTWDDNKYEATGRSYDYFCRSGNDKNFTDSHKPNVAIFNDGIKEEKLYNLPSNIAQTEYASEENIFTPFTADGMNYVICGYNEAQLVKSNKTGAVEIPEQVIYRDITHSVTVIGTVYGDKNTVSNVLSNGTISLSIPKTVSFIWDLSLKCPTLSSVRAATESPYFYTDEDGVLYTKNRFTLIYYPAAKLQLSYTVDSACRIIALSAFDNSRLNYLSVSSNMQEYYLPNFGLGYFDNATDYTASAKRIEEVCNMLSTSSVKTRLTAEQFKTETGIRNLNTY